MEMASMGCTWFLADPAMLNGVLMIWKPTGANQHSPPGADVGKLYRSHKVKLMRLVAWLEHNRVPVGRDAAQAIWEERNPGLVGWKQMSASEEKDLLSWDKATAEMVTEHVCGVDGYATSLGLAEKFRHTNLTYREAVKAWRAQEVEGNWFSHAYLPVAVGHFIHRHKRWPRHGDLDTCFSVFFEDKWARANHTRNWKGLMAMFAAPGAYAQRSDALRAIRGGPPTMALTDRTTAARSRPAITAGAGSQVRSGGPP